MDGGHILGFNITDLPDHSPVILLQSVAVQLGQSPGLTCMKHHTLDALAIDVAVCFVGEVERGVHRQQPLELLPGGLDVCPVARSQSLAADSVSPR